MSELALIFAIVLGVNLLPAFGPPTWSIMVFCELTYNVHPVPLILTGVVAAAVGRFALAHGARWSRTWLPQSYVANMADFGEVVKQRSTKAWWLIAMFFVSPLPSAQLFVAAGLMPSVPLAPITLAFAVGRIFTYSLYVGAAHQLAATNVGQIVTDHLTSPSGLITELVMLGMLISLGRVKWRKHLR